MKFRTVFICNSICCSLGGVAPSTVYMSSNGSDANSGKTESTPVHTLSRALSLSNANGNIRVAAGRYVLSESVAIEGFEFVSLIGPELSIASGQIPLATFQSSADNRIVVRRSGTSFEMLKFECSGCTSMHIESGRANFFNSVVSNRLSDSDNSDIDIDIDSDFDDDNKDLELRPLAVVFSAPSPSIGVGCATFNAAVSRFEPVALGIEVSDRYLPLNVSDCGLDGGRFQLIFNFDGQCSGDGENTSILRGDESVAKLGYDLSIARSAMSGCSARAIDFPWARSVVVRDTVFHDCNGLGTMRVGATDSLHFDNVKFFECSAAPGTNSSAGVSVTSGRSFAMANSLLSSLRSDNVAALQIDTAVATVTSTYFNSLSGASGSSSAGAIAFAPASLAGSKLSLSADVFADIDGASVVSCNGAAVAVDQSNRFPPPTAAQQTFADDCHQNKKVQSFN
jgi:Protein of unknown function (DUF1565)